MKEHKTHIPPHPAPLPPGERVTVGKIHQTFSSSLKGKGNPYTLPSTLTGEGQGGGDKRRGGLLGYPLFNSRGISVLFLLIAMMLMVAIGYVFSYLIPAKHKSVVFPIQSTQAFFIAQSGVEFAIRYAQVNGVGALNGMTRSLPDDIAPIGRFSLIYNSAGTGTLTSVGEVPIGTERRRITVSNFTQFLSQSGLVLWTPVPCRASNTQIRFIIKNVGSSSITLNRFSATWTVPPNIRDITSITFGASTAFSGNYNYPSCTPCVRNFTANQTVNPNQEITVLVTWDQNITGQLPATISFYDTTGIQYQFTLNPTGSC